MSSYTTGATLAIPSAPLHQACPSRLDAGPSALRRRLHASAFTSGAAHRLLSRQRPGAICAPHASAPVSALMPCPRATAKAEQLSAVTKLPPPCTKGCAPPAPSLPCRCPCSPTFPPLAACKVFEAMPEPRVASIVPIKSSVLRSKGYLDWLDSFPLLWSVARWFSLTFLMLRTTGISARLDSLIVKAKGDHS
jgi:hypothetical protein